MAAQDSAPEKLLTPAEIAAIDRENMMWRLLRADEEVETNLKILRDAGFAADDIKGIEPKLTELWTVTFERHFGWLTAETVERIQEIDHNYTARMRAARLRKETGVQIMAPYLSTPRQVSAQWHWAIMNALDYDEIAEFRLMNSQAARQVTTLTNGISLTESERRQLNEWQSDFDAVYGREAVRGTWSQSENNRWRKQARLDFMARIRELLGDERSGIYLSTMSPEFRRMRESLDKIGGGEAKTALDVWWIRQKYQMAREGENRWAEVAKLAAAERDELTTALGDECFARYAKTPDVARWLYPPQRFVPPPRSSPPPRIAEQAKSSD